MHPPRPAPCPSGRGGAAARGARVRNHLRVTLLAVKLLLAPSFVVAASLVARRFGPRVGGLIAGLPLVAGRPADLRAQPRTRVRRQRGRRDTARAGLADRLHRRLRPPRRAPVVGREPAPRLARLRGDDRPLHRRLGARRGRARPRRHGPADRPRRAPQAAVDTDRPRTAAVVGSTAAGRLRARAGADALRRLGLARPAAERPARAVPDHRHSARHVHPRPAGQRRTAAPAARPGRRAERVRAVLLHARARAGPADRPHRRSRWRPRALLAQGGILALTGGEPAPRPSPRISANAAGARRRAAVSGGCARAARRSATSPMRSARRARPRASQVSRAKAA